MFCARPAPTMFCGTLKPSQQKSRDAAAPILTGEDALRIQAVMIEVRRGLMLSAFDQFLDGKAFYSLEVPEIERDN